MNYPADESEWTKGSFIELLRLKLARGLSASCATSTRGTHVASGGTINEDYSKRSVSRLRHIDRFEGRVWLLGNTKRFSRNNLTETAQ
jgi:hypothetical protein